MINPRHLLLAFACAAFTTTSSFAADPAPAAEPAQAEAAAPVAKLDVGSPAPALRPQKWIQGEPVTAFEKDKVYVIECWATWCGPCVAAIPHVNELHKKFKDKGLVVIGMNVWEDPVAKAEGFVKKKGEGMAYRVAYDGGAAGDTAKNWLMAAGVNGIPHAFVVRENKILWHGHPSELTETTVEDMLAGKFDPAKAAAAAKEKDALLEEFHASGQKFHELISEKKYTEAEAALNRQVELVAKIAPEQAAFIRHGGLIEIALSQGDKKAGAKRIREFALAGRAEGGEISSQWAAALQILSEPRLAGERDYALALECVDLLMARETEAAENVFVRFVRARLLDANGKSADAIKALEAVVAMEHAPAEAKTALDALKAGKPWPADRLNPDAKLNAPVAAEAKPAEAAEKKPVTAPDAKPAEAAPAQETK